MLLEFRTQNYKSFVEETVLSMTAAPKQTGLDYSLCRHQIKNKVWKGLCSSVIYGPNAAGKTNIIGAMDTFRAIVLRGNIKNAEEKNTPNVAASNLELIPNKDSDETRPVCFYVNFIEKNLQVEYSLQLDLGTFLDDSYKRRVMSEELKINGDRIFHRMSENDENPLFISLSTITDYLPHDFSDVEPYIEQITKSSLNQDELLLMNGFKLIISPKLTKIISDWFTNKFMVIYRADSMQLIKRFEDPKRRTIYIERSTNKAAEIFGINSNGIGYRIKDDDSEAELCSIFDDLKSEKSIAIAAEIFESYGTIRFINIFPLIIRAIKTGGTLVIDEFDASIHPMALMSIINVFHNDEININHAQLIFDTHNPIFLNGNLFRRDEIKFVEREDNNHYSSLYSLSDFKTSGKNGVRKHEDYMKNYFVSRYGAIRDIDFTPIFEDIIKFEGEV
ncbi:MAG: ATP-binding protein [Ruminococcus sp.]|nr:ATP-binding protein [Ruminococcus sp.]